MRYSASEKLEIIRLVEQSSLPVRRTLSQLSIPKSTFYGWYRRYVQGGLDARPLIGLDPESAEVEDKNVASQHKSVQSSKGAKKKDSKCRQRWRWFDDNYIKRYVGGDTSRSKHLVRNSIASKESVMNSMNTNHEQQRPLMDEIKEQQDEYRDSSVIRPEDYKAPDEEPSEQKGINTSKEK